MKNRDNFQYISRLSGALFLAEDRRYAQQIDRLFKDNRQIVPRHGDGFSYGGDIFKPIEVTHRGKLRFTPLDESLVPEMQEILRDRTQVTEERQFVDQILYKLLYDCQDNQDCRNALPECLHNILPELNQLSRTQPEAYTIRDDERIWAQYQKILPQIQFYSATRLLY